MCDGWARWAGRSSKEVLALTAATDAGSPATREATRRVAVTALLAILILLGMPAVRAAGWFDWYCYFTHRCVSRTYETPNSGTHSITQTYANCPGPGNRVRYRIVHEEFGPDTFYRWKNVSCGTTDQTKSWSIPQIGPFHFDAEKADTTDTSYTWYIEGETTYP